MPPGRHQKPHGHEEVNESSYVISGEIKVMENDAEAVLKSGDAVLFEKGKVHAITNDSRNDALILTIKQPRKPDDKFYRTSSEENPLNWEVLLRILEQNWAHARHQEEERTWFTKIYAIIVTGVLGFVSIKGLKDSFLLILFLIYLSITGIIATYKLSAEFHNHMAKIELIVDKLKAKNYMGLPLGRVKGGRWKIFRVTFTFYLLYIVIIIGCTAMLVITFL